MTKCMWNMWHTSNQIKNKRNINTFKALTQNIPNDMKQIIGNMIFNEEQFKALLLNKISINVASDGSVKHNKGTAAWTIWDNYEPIISTQVLVERVNIDSYRAGLTRICGVLSFIWLIQQHLVPLKFKFYCDSESAIKMIQKMLQPLQLHMTKT